MSCVPTDEPLAVAAVHAIHTGNLAALQRLLDEDPTLATARFGTDGPGGMTRSLLHVATDWPGHYPNGGATVAMLVQAGRHRGARGCPARSHLA